jgi:hypothetical protein
MAAGHAWWRWTVFAAGAAGAVGAARLLSELGDDEWVLVQRDDEAAIAGREARSDC